MVLDGCIVRQTRKERNVEAEVAWEGSRLKYTFSGHAVRWIVTLDPSQREIMSAETLSALFIRNNEYCILRLCRTVQYLISSERTLHF